MPYAGLAEGHALLDTATAQRDADRVAGVDDRALLESLLKSGQDRRKDHLISAWMGYLEAK